jgi:hypothetical protein
MQYGIDSVAMQMGYGPIDGLGLGMGAMGYGVGPDGWGLEDTLAGPPARMMLVSPALPAVREGNEDSNALSRKEKRRRKRMGGAGQGGPLVTPMEAVPAMQL